ncbi:MAG: type II toxin-antitoxin system PemK/MazF family toxin [Candidatus Hydrogenedentes bacterium]|nr:type II toxin-antitoxin system PemK/MazF family toxin [Candidatus Hydrogenedentota bacterium]
MNRGEVRWYKFKKRPVVLLTRDSILAYLGEVTVAPINTTVRDIPSEVPLGKADGMERDCAVNCDHIQTVSKGEVGKFITMLSAKKQEELRREIHFAIDL